MPPKVQTISFFDLGPEIRNRIYEFSLASPAIIRVRAFNAKSWIAAGVDELGTDAPQLLEVCHQIENEATAMFYATKTFKISLSRKKASAVARCYHIDLMWNVEIAHCSRLLDVWVILANLDSVHWLRGLHIPAPLQENPLTFTFPRDINETYEEFAASLWPLMWSLRRAGRNEEECLGVLDFYPRPVSVDDHDAVKTPLEEARRAEVAAKYQQEVVRRLERRKVAEEQGDTQHKVLNTKRVRVRKLTLRVPKIHKDREEQQ